MPRLTLAKRSIPKSNPIPSTLSTVNGYPDRLKIYQIPASPYWWCRATFGERRITRSTGHTERKKAISFAREFYEGLLRHDSLVPIATSKSFERCAMALLDEHRQRTSAGERNARFADDLRKQLTHRILPYFRSHPLKAIDYQVMSRFVDSMRKEKASSSTIQRNLVSVRQILKHAQKLGLIDSVPVFPVITTKDNPRPWFSDEEYRLLKTTARSVARKSIVIKNEPLTKEVRDFIVFMVNTFLRPSDWYNLQRKHVRVQERTNDTPFLVISPPSSKTINSPVISMPNAVPVYKHITNRQDLAHTLNDDAYVFLPHISNRDRARDLMRRFFDYVVREAKLIQIAQPGVKVPSV